MNRLRLIADRSAVLERWLMPAMARLALPMPTLIRALPRLRVALLSSLALASFCPGIPGCRCLASLLSRLLALTAVPS